MTDSEPTYRQRVLSSLAWQGSAQLLGQVISWASTILVIRLLDPSDYGLMAMATLFVGFVLLLADLGIGAAIVQADSLDDEDLRAIQAFIFVFNGLAFALTLFGSELIAGFFDQPDLTPILNTLSLTFLMLSAYLLPQSMLMRELRFDQKAKVDLAANVLSAIAAWAVAFAGFGVWALVAGAFASHVVRAVGFNVAVPRWIWPSLSFESFGRADRFIRFGFAIVLSRVLWFAYSNIDITIAGKLLGAEALGFYSVALTLAVIPLGKVMPVVTQVAFPAVSRIQHDKARVRQNMLRALRYGNMLFLPVFWGMAWVGEDAIVVLLGPEWALAVIPFQLTCLVLPLKALSTLLPPALFGMGRGMVNVFNQAVGLVVMSIGFAVGAQWGIVGLAYAWLLVYPLVFLVTGTTALPVVGITWTDVLDACRSSLVAALLMSIAVLLVQGWLGGVNAPIRLVLSILAGVVTYTGVMFVTDRPMIGELRSLAGR